MGLQGRFWPLNSSKHRLEALKLLNLLIWPFIFANCFADYTAEPWTTRRSGHQHGSSRNPGYNLQSVLSVQGSTLEGSTNCRSCSAVVFTGEKHPRRPTQSTPELFKGQPHLEWPQQKKLGRFVEEKESRENLRLEISKNLISKQIGNID